MLTFAGLGGLALGLALGIFGISFWLILPVTVALFSFTNWDFVQLIIKTLPRDLKVGLRYLKIILKLRYLQYYNISVIDVFIQNAAKFPHKTAFIFEDTKWTFKQVDEYSSKICDIFRKAGYQKGTTIGLFMENRPEYVAIWVGLAKAGLVPALINFNQRGAQLTHSLKAADCEALILSAEMQDVVAEINTEVKCYVSLVEKGKLTIGEDLDKLMQEASSRQDIVKTAFTDKLLYIYTSGTTGMPKAAVIKNSRFLWMGYGIIIGFNMDIDTDILYTTLPLYHTAGGILGVGNCLLGGITICLRRKFSVREFWIEAAKNKVTVAQYIGEICRYLLSAPRKEEDKQHSIRLMFGNGLRKQIWSEFQERFNIPQIMEFYGSTEGNTNIVNTENKVGAVGFTSVVFPKALPLALIKIDEATDLPERDEHGLCITCKPGEPGEMVGKITRDPIRDFTGYADKKATEKKIIKDVIRKGDKFFRSGDLLRMDEEGYFYFLDRTGDTYRWRGENVSTNEVEALVSNIVHLKDACSYGVEVPGAEGRAGMVAIADPNQNVDMNALYAGIKKQLPTFAQPLFVRQVKTIDKTGTHKIKKNEYQNQGFDPNVVSDPLYFLDNKQGKYVPLDKQLYEEIKSGKMRL